jgi:hypothetical protein
MSDELGEDLDAAYDPVGSMLEDLSEEQKQEIVDEVGERVVEGLKEKNQETFLRDLEGAVIGNLPVLGMSRIVQTGIRHAVREIFDERTEDMIQDAGDVVVERLVEYHSDEIVEDVMRTTVRKLQNGD